MKKLLLILFGLTIFSNLSQADTITLTKCFTISDNKTSRFTGPWANVWGIKKNLMKMFLKKISMFLKLQQKNLSIIIDIKKTIIKY